MRILLIDVNCKYLSTGKIVYDLFKRLKEDGYDAAVCYGRGDQIEEKAIYKFGLDWETCMHAALARITGLNGYFSFFSTRRLIRYIEKFKPDVIHLHELHAYFLTLKPFLDFIKSRKIKIIWTFHCEYMYTGKCGYAYECPNFQKECGNCPSIHDYPKSIFFDRTKKMFQDKKKLLNDLEFTIVTPSEWLENRVRMSFLRGKKIRTIYNGIDTENIFYPHGGEEIRKKYKLYERKIILSIAPNIMDERKGGRYIIELSKVMRERNVCFVLIGVDETKKISDNVLLIKRTYDQEELAKWYSCADLFLLCSRRETFSLVTAESLSCGTPVIGFKAGAPESIAIQEYSEFVEYGNISKLRDVVEKWLGKYIDRDDLAKRAKEVYSLSNMYKNYLEEYQ